MTAEPRFLQIHTVTPYTGALLNRDDTGMAKRLPYGDALRTRISSQCLKRHWRVAEDPHGLERMEGAGPSYRSRELVTRKVIGPLNDRFPADIVSAVEREIQQAVYGEKGAARSSRQTLLLGTPEIGWLSSEAERLATGAKDAADARRAASEWRKKYRQNVNAMRSAATLPAGLTAAVFGRMVTSDPDANITAPVHVAHAFTVHGEEAEIDYLTAVDDLSGTDDPGADTIQETELTSGLFYGYVVVDLPGLVKNLGGDANLAGSVLYNLVYLIAEVSPGAKLGSTAPYSRASLMLLEAGDRQPRTLAEAYRSPCAPNLTAAAAAMAAHLKLLDDAYDTGEERHVMALVDVQLPRAARESLAGLATWARTLLGALE